VVVEELISQLGIINTLIPNEANILI